MNRYKSKLWKIISTLWDLNLRKLNSQDIIKINSQTRKLLMVLTVKIKLFLIVNIFKIPVDRKIIN